MENEWPVGALTPQQLERIRTALSKGGSGFVSATSGYYGVRNKDALLHKAAEGPENGLGLGASPVSWYYFDNYFHALAYSLQLKKRIEDGKARPKAKA